MVNGNRIIRRRQRREIPCPHPVVQRGFDQLRDTAKPDSLRDESRHRDLIRRIVDGGRAVADAQRVIGEFQSGEPVVIRRLERQRADLGKIQLAARPLMRSGQPRQCAIGVRMSGVPSCAITERSENSTMP